MRGFLFGFFALFLLTACLPDDDSKAEENNADVGVENTAAAAAPTDPLKAICDSGNFPAAQAVSDENNSYKNACRLSQLSGIKIDGVDSVYLCQSELMSDDQAETQTDKFFKAADVKAALGEEVADQANLLSSYGFIGKKFAVLLLNAGGHTTALSTREQLITQPVTLETPEAALAWAYLSGALGQGVGTGFAPKALCGATLSEDPEGWTVNQAEVFTNCAPKEHRDIRITKSGQVSVLSKEIIPNSPVLCVD